MGVIKSNSTYTVPGRQKNVSSRGTVGLFLTDFLEAIENHSNPRSGGTPSMVRVHRPWTLDYFASSTCGKLSSPLMKLSHRSIFSCAAQRIQILHYDIIRHFVHRVMI